MACAIENYTTEQCITEGFPIYDQYADILLQPDVREAAIKRGNLPNFMLYLQDWRRGLLGGSSMSSERVVKTRTYMWEEMNYHNNPYLFTIEKENAAGAPGAPVTATIIRPVGSEGQTAPATGYTAFANVAGAIVQVRITDVTDDQIQLTPINGQALDFTAQNTTFTFDPNYVYDGNCENPIPTTGWQQTQMQIGTGTIQTYENGKCICDNALTHYGYNFIPKKMQMQDPLTGGWLDTWCLPNAVQDIVTEGMFYGQFVQMMFGQYDFTQDAGINGLIPSILSQGGFNMPINTSDAKSMLAGLKIIAMEYYRLNIKSFDLWCDITMYTNLNQGLAELIGPNNFSLPIWNGNAKGNAVADSGSGHIEWYGFRSLGNLLGMDIDVRINVIQGWEQMSLFQVYKDFAILMPNTPYMTQDGAAIPQIEITRLAGCEAWQVAPRNSSGSRMWYYDFRLQGGRKLEIYGKNEFGMDIHGLPFMGILTGNQCPLNYQVVA